MEIELYFVPLCIFFGVFVLGGILILPGVRGRERYYLGFEFIGEGLSIAGIIFPDNFECVLPVLSEMSHRRLIDQLVY